MTTATTIELRPRQKAHWDIDWQYRLMVNGRATGKDVAGIAAMNEAATEQGYDRLAVISLTHRDSRQLQQKMPHWGDAKVEYLAAMDNQSIRTLGIFRPQVIWANDMALWPFADPKDYNHGQGMWDMDMWSMVQFCAIMHNTRVIVTTTPRMEPGTNDLIPALKNLINRENVLFTRESTHDNAENLPKDFMANVRTYLGPMREQEVDGKTFTRQE